MSDTITVPLTFHHTGATGFMSWEERMLLRRTRHMLSGWSYQHWTDLDLLALFQSDLPQWAGRFQQITKGVVKADIGRYAIMHCRGGVYIDTDYKFLRYPSELLESSCTLPIEDGAVDERGSVRDRGRFRLGNACLSSVKGHSFWLELIDDIFSNRTTADLNDGDPIETTGPAALTRFWLDRPHHRGDIATPPMVKFYPDLTWSRVGLARSSETSGIHMCWGTWRTRQLVHSMKTVVRRKVSCLV